MRTLVFLLRCQAAVGAVASVGALGLLISLSLGSFSVIGASTRHATRPGEWTTYGGSFLRQGLQTSRAPSAPLRTAWTFNDRHGAIFGEPLIWNGKVFVGTESDVVMALSADNGRMLWSTRLGAPVPSGKLPCGNISPTVGITSTMVIDPSNGRLFVSAETSSRGRVHHLLFALSATTGRKLFSRVVDLRWDAKSQLQRSALALDAGKVLLGFGGNFGDCGTYRGYLIGVPESGTGSLSIYRPPSSQGDAIWAPAGVSVDSAGHIYLATGNGASSSRFDMANAVVELSGALRPMDWFAPVTWKQDSANDSDLGSTAPVLLPHGRMFSAGKSAEGFLLRAGHLGGIGSQLSELGICQTWGGTAYFRSVVYLPCTFSGKMLALRVVNERLELAWQTGAASGPPSVGGGAVWSVGGGHLLGLDPRNGGVIDSLAAPETEHFAAPAIGEGLLVVGGTSQVTAYR